MRQRHGDIGGFTRGADAGWDFRVLGPWEINGVGGGVAVPARQTRVLLSSLLLSANRPVPVEALTRQLWPEQTPARVRPTLHTYVARLRKLLGNQLIRTTPGGGYQLDVPAESVDLQRFRTLVHRAGAAATPGAELALLRSALRLWRGRPFTGVPSAWLDRDVVPLLTEEWFAATERRIDLDLATGPAAAPIAELRDLTTRYPARESLWLRLITALHLAGRRAEALDAYRQVRAILRTELGVDPNPALQRLQRAVLVGEAPEPSGGPAGAAARRGRAARPATAAAPGAVVRPAPAGRAVVRQLPHALANFTTRAELAQLDALRVAIAADDQLTHVVTIVGAPGTGKSALAVYWAHRVAGGYPDLQLYLDLRGSGPGEPVAPPAAAAALLRGLGVPHAAVPASVAERATLLRSVLAGRRALLLLEDARDADQVRPLLPGTASLVIVTSRDPLRNLSIHVGARRVVLHRLSRRESLALLARTVGADRVAAEPEAADRLVELCAGLPLRLAAAAERADRLGTLTETVRGWGRHHCDRPFRRSRANQREIISSHHDLP